MDAVVVNDVGSAERASSLYPNHQKIGSWLMLWRIGLPTLPGIILDDWSLENEARVREFGASVGADSLLVRSDRAPETGDYPPAGNISPIDGLREVTMRYLQRGRVLFLLEPMSRFDDLFSLSVGFHGPRQANVEVVGPGFDASDLKRGDASPHEWFDVTFGAPDRRTVIENRHVVTPRAYRRSWEERLSKVGRLVTGGYPTSNRSAEALAKTGKKWLLEHGSPLLLENRKQYRPIPDELLTTVLAQCAGLPEQLAEMGAEHDVFVVSLSFVGRRADQVYWDIVWPATKFEVRSTETGR